MSVSFKKGHIINDTGVYFQVAFNRVVRKIFSREIVTRDWRKFHNELQNLYLSPNNIIMVIKSRRMRWKGREVHIKFSGWRYTAIFF